MPTPIAILDVIVLDCPNPPELARFYQQIIGGELRGPDPDDEWTELHTAQGKLAFQKIDDYRPPTWPNGDIPQQFHIDANVPDLDAGEAAVLAIGARKAAVQPLPTSFRVYLDPAGKPFCLVNDPSLRTD